jgi:hypothetical protein
MTTAPRFTAWLDDFFASYYRWRPVNATFIGVHRYDDRLPDYSERAIEELAQELARLERDLQKLPSEQLSVAEELDRSLAEGFLKIQRWELASGHFQRGNPCVYTGEAIFGVIALFLRPFASLLQRIEAAVSRMQAIPILLQQGEENVREAPAAWTERAVRECMGASLFLRNGIDILIAQHGITDARLREAADQAADAFGRFQRYLETELMRQATDTYACGADAFALLLRSGHFLDQTAEEIEAAAQAEFDASNAYLIQHATDFDAPTWQEAIAGLADIHPSAEHYYARYGELWDASKATAAEHALLTWPDFPIRYVAQPEWAREAAPYLYFLFYRAPAAFDDLPMTLYLVTPIEPDMPLDVQESKLRATNDSVIKLNHVVHHGGIGHHVQNWHAMRAESRIGQIAAVDCASRTALFCGGTMAEGWACYTTELMGEVGFLTPLERYAERHARLRMAARTLVDIRLHDGRYDLEQAAAFYRDQVGMNESAARGEAVKNSMFPGTATMYLVGTDLIHALRHELAARDGEAFNLSHFHDRFLSYGSVPVSCIAALMRNGALIDQDNAKGGVAATTVV